MLNTQTLKGTIPMIQSARSPTLRNKSKMVAYQKLGKRRTEPKTLFQSVRRSKSKRASAQLSR